MILDIEFFPYFTANYAWFLYGMLHWAEMGKKRVFITEDFKLKSTKLSPSTCL